MRLEDELYNVHVASVLEDMDHEDIDAEATKGKDEASSKDVEMAVAVSLCQKHNYVHNYMHKCTNAQMHKSAKYAQMHKCEMPNVVPKCTVA